MVLFQALNWLSKDINYKHYIIIFGKTKLGESVCVNVHYKPFFYIKNSDYSVVEDVIDPVRISTENYKCLIGYQEDVDEYKKLEFDSLYKMYSNRKKLTENKIKTYESNLDPILKFMHDTKIKSTGWIELTENNFSKGVFSKCDLNFASDVRMTNYKKHIKPVDMDDIAPFVIASIDIECYSSTGEFPNADVKGDECFQIAVSLEKINCEDGIYKKICFTSKKTNKLDEDDVLCYEDEKTMIEGFCKFIMIENVDIITGWNVFGFDFEYLDKRYKLLNNKKSCLPMNRCIERVKEDTKIVKKKLYSSALGDNDLNILKIPGIFTFDMFHEIKKEYKLDSYKLDNVSKHFLNDQKIDISPKEMFSIYKSGDPEGLKRVAEYCIKDTILPHRLMKKLCTVINMIEMAKATWVPINYLSERGQQVKVYSQIVKKSKEMGYIVPSSNYDNTSPSEVNYEGATVLEAKIGAYYEPITALDFEGLYPSIMMAHNLCYSTLISERDIAKYPDLKYEKIGENYFVQDVRSVLPSILSELKSFRKQAKKDMASSTGYKKQMYNAKQLAYKISMNSVYGFTGVSKGFLPEVRIASSVTMKGRDMIETTKNYVESNFEGSEVIYGDTDSVMVKFDVGDRTGEEALEYSWELGEKAANECTQLFKKPNNLELEKVYYPYFLYSKKRYAAKLWTMKDHKMNMDYIDVKGLQLVRRDNTQYVRDVCKELLNVILDSKDKEKPIQLALKRGEELLSGKVPMEKLILSQTLSSKYKVKGVDVEIKSGHDDVKNVNRAHVCVHNKMMERQPGSEPGTGDRVSYVLVKNDIKNARAFEKAEDPNYVKEHNIEIDYDYYYIHKFIKPVKDLIEPLVGDTTELFKPKKEKTIKSSKKKTNKDIEQLFNNE